MIINISNIYYVLTGCDSSIYIMRMYVNTHIHYMFKKNTTLISHLVKEKTESQKTI